MVAYLRVADGATEEAEEEAATAEEEALAAAASSSLGTQDLSSLSATVIYAKEISKGPSFISGDIGLTAPVQASAPVESSKDIITS